MKQNCFEVENGFFSILKEINLYRYIRSLYDHLFPFINNRRMDE